MWQLQRTQRQPYIFSLVPSDIPKEQEGMSSSSTAVPRTRPASEGRLSLAERGFASPQWLQPAARSSRSCPSLRVSEPGSEDSTESCSSSSEVESSSAEDCAAAAPDFRIKRGWRWNYMANWGLRAARAAKFGGPKPQRLPDGTWVTARWWGITRAQIEDFYRKCREDPNWSDDDTVAAFVPKFVKPVTEGSGMGLALFLNQEAPRHVNVMISHAWLENAQAFFEDVLKHTIDIEVAFICFLSNYQGTVGEINDQLGEDMSRSPFTEVLSSMHCNRLLVVPNEELKESGEGLYSRLWCDWEIKVAADMGLPIHITQRKDLDYLLGSKSPGSKHARCGNPHDQELIREAIETKPAENGKFHSSGVFVFSICVAYGPRVAVHFFGKKGWVWLAGYPAGIIVGFIVLFGILRPARNSVNRCRGMDGYSKLDSIIKAAARREYVHRRFRPLIDLPVMASISLTGGLVRLLVEVKVNHGKHNVCSDEYFFAILAGLYEGLLLWPVLHINSMGPWTGVFFLNLRSCILAGLFLCCMISSGALIFSKVLDRDGQGQGALWGVLTGMMALSLAFGRKTYAAGLAMVLGYMVGTYFFMRYMDSWLLWRDTILVALGFCGYTLVPGLSTKQVMVAWLIGPCFVVGLALLTCRGGDVSLGCTDRSIAHV